METILIILLSVFGASLLMLIIVLLTLKQNTPGKTVVVIKDKRKQKTEKAQKQQEVQPKQKHSKKNDDELVLNPVYCSISFDCSKCGKKFLVQEQKLSQDIVCPDCGQVLDKQEYFKLVLKDELKNQTKEQELFLGMSYLYGVGVKKDDKKAYLFVNLSAYNGDEVAKQMLLNYYSEEIAKLTKENIKDVTTDKLELLIKEQKLQYNKSQVEPKTVNELHNHAIDYFWWATYHRMNCYDVDALATVGGVEINSNKILNVMDGFEEIDLNSIECKLAFAYLDIAANNGRYDLYSELGFACIGHDNEKAKKYLKKGIECGDERSKEIYAVYFEGKTPEEARILKIKAPKEVVLLTDSKETKIKAREKAEAKEAKVQKADVKSENIEISVDEMFEEKPKDKKAEKKEEKPKAKKQTKKVATETKKETKTKEKKPKKETKEQEERKISVVKKKKTKKETQEKQDQKSKEEVLEEIKEKSSKDAKPEEKVETAETLAQKVQKLEQKVEKLEKSEEKKASDQNK